MTSAESLLAELERTTAALGVELDGSPEEALAARSRVLEGLAALPAPLDPFQSERLEAALAEGRRLVRQARERRTALLRAVQEAAAARHFTATLKPAGRLAVVDFTI